ncbi:MAG: hypothetical protein II132_10165, partial [Desulfovibrio sp.]|nr:hypothetical protein [Desulfovibrio sp.]
ELHLQQELQVDGDVLCQGVDRKAYQYSLLRATMLGGGPVCGFRRTPQKVRLLPPDLFRELELAIVRDVEPPHDARPAPA